MNNNGSGSDDWIYLTLLCTISLNYMPYRVIADLCTFQFTATHALGFSVSTSRCLVVDLNTETITLNHYEVFPSFPAAVNSEDLIHFSSDRTLHRNSSVLQSLYCMVLICTKLISATHCVPSGTDHTANTTHTLFRGTDHIENTSTVLLRGVDHIENISTALLCGAYVGTCLPSPAVL
jgi:hypothetical protein